MLSSLCVTKAVPEQKNLKIPVLDRMTVSEHYAMVSLHFRKRSRAFQEIRESREGLNMSLLDRICRWAVLAERLKATEEKIRVIQSGKIKASGLLERTEIFRKNPAPNIPKEIGRRSGRHLPYQCSAPSRGRSSSRRNAETQKKHGVNGECRGYTIHTEFVQDRQKMLAAAYAEKLQKDQPGKGLKQGGMEAAEKIPDINLEKLMSRFRKEILSGPGPDPHREGSPDAPGNSAKKDERRKDETVVESIICPN